MIARTVDSLAIRVAVVLVNILEFFVLHHSHELQ